MSKQFLFWASLAGLPLVSHAQTASPRFYLGVGANLLADAPFSSAGVPSLLGPSITAGKQLNTKLALQVGLSYFWRKKLETDSYTYYNGSGQVLINGSTFSTDSKFLIMPVLLRYAFTAPGKRFNVDGLGGVTVLYSHHHYVSTTNYTPTAYSSESNSSFVRFNLTLGPSVRYAVAPNVELTANGLINATLGDWNGRFSDHLFCNALLGANYTFGQH